MRFVYISGIFLGVSVGGWVYRGFFFIFPLISYRVLIVFSLIGGDSRQDKGILFLVSRGGGACATMLRRLTVDGQKGGVCDGHGADELWAGSSVHEQDGKGRIRSR